MTLFGVLIIVLFAATAVFYVVFFSLIYYWHEKKTTYVVVPALYTFEFFAIGFLIISIVSIIAKFLPQILSLINKQ